MGMARLNGYLVILSYTSVILIDIKNSIYIYIFSIALEIVITFYYSTV